MTVGLNNNYHLSIFCWESPGSWHSCRSHETVHQNFSCSASTPTMAPAYGNGIGHPNRKVRAATAQKTDCLRSITKTVASNFTRSKSDLHPWDTFIHGCQKQCLGGFYGSKNMNARADGFPQEHSTVPMICVLYFFCQ